ncbi:MAG: hypothetical protein ACTSUE_15585, partial [Promethearchaeota archaeon]
IFEDALENKENSGGFSHDTMEILYLYPWLKIFLSLISIPAFTYRVANLVSKHFSGLLKTESPDALVRVCFDQGLNVQYLDKEALKINAVVHDFKMYFTNFLENTVSFKSPDWKLVNRVIKNGYVYLKKPDLARIIEEKVKEKIVEVNKWKKNKELLDKITKDPFLKLFYEEMLEKCKTKVSSFNTGGINLPVDDSSFPPCINYILDKNSKGQNLTHTERLFMTYFLLTIGKTVEDVLNLFKIQPDFNEKIARYQVEFAAGLHGKKTTYKPHNCMKLASLNICMKDDKNYTNRQCTDPRFSFKNPLQIYKRIIKEKEYLATREAAREREKGSGENLPAGSMEGGGKEGKSNS